MKPSSTTIDLEFIRSLYRNLTEELSNISAEKKLKRLSEAIRITKKHTEKLKEYVKAHQFEQIGHQIEFFKHLKPKFYSRLFYYSQLYYILIKVPIGCLRAQHGYFQSELEKINADFEAHKEFYIYLRSGEMNRDVNYFSIGNHLDFLLHPLIQLIDAEYSTGFDLLVANYWANVKLARHLSRKLSGAEKNLSSPDNSKEKTKMIWTDSKTSLIELIYALKAKGSFSYGKATLKDITDCFQKTFGVELNNPSRDFQEILRRKKGATIYLDGLKENYLRNIDEIEQCALQNRLRQQI